MFRKNMEISPEKVPKTKKKMKGWAIAGTQIRAATPK
tara:strand:- start:40 stop:150 length:111 start_codon:yes stop_codon:yes gene_type:complete